MKLSLLLAALVAAALLALERVLARAEDRTDAEPPIERLVGGERAADLDVAGISIVRHGGASPWIYVRRDGAWHCASAFGAPALSNAVEKLVADLRDALGPRRTSDPTRHAAYGFDGAEMLTVALYGPAPADDPTRDPLFAVDLGRALPGAGRGRCFARASGSSAVLEIQRNPRALLLGEEQGALPPLLDRRVLAGEFPPAGEGVVRAFLDFDDGRAIELRLFGPLEDWIAIEGDTRASCLPYRVAGWQAFLFRVPYLGFADPRSAAELGFERGPRARVTLFLADGSSIELGLGRPAGARAFVSNAKTGMLCLVEPAHAPLFAPTLDMLCEPSLANPWEEWLAR